MTTVQARFQLWRGRTLVPLLVAAAKKYDLPPAYVLAVASRETGIQNILGDGGNGVGVIQIDIRYHAVAKTEKVTGTWRTHPAKLIDYGVSMLQGNVGWAARTWPQYSYQQHLKIGASAYNAGRGGASFGVHDGDSDLRTTGKNYGADVLQRMSVFARLVK